MIRISPEADSPQECLAAMCVARAELGFLLLMSSTSMNTVGTRPCDVGREYTVTNQQMPSKRWPLAVLEKHPALTDLPCV